MKIGASFLALALAATPTIAASPHSPLPAAQCIDTTQINEWHIVDTRTAIVRTGPKHYLVRLESACPQLRHPPGLIFRASRANASVQSGRICGDAGETVRSAGQPPCAIQSVRKIDKHRFDALKHAAGKTTAKSAAMPPE